MTTSVAKMTSVKDDPLSAPKKKVEFFPEKKPQQSLTDLLTSTPVENYSKEELEFNRKFYKDEKYIRENAKLFPSEKLEDTEKAGYKNEDPLSKGIIIITNFRLIFCFEDPKNQRNKQYGEDYFRIPLFTIQKIEKIEDKKIIDRYVLDITLKNTRKLNFIIFNKENLKLYADLNELAFPNDHNKYFEFSFEYLKYLWSFMNFEDGWKLYDAKQEYLRQGITEDKSTNLRFTEINSDYSLCDTYPPLLVVPANCDDTLLKNAANSRSKNRLPVLSYFYNKKNIKACLWRSSQIMTGLLGSKNEYDSLYIEKIISFNKGLNIFDCRGQMTAVANKLMGGGYENEEKYSNAVVNFCDIGNIHEARKAINSLYTLAQNTTLMDYQKAWSFIESSNWYEFIQRLLKYSCKIIYNLLDNKSVLVHCSDGWDRATQLVSLSELLIDPYYRTIKGFSVLVEKEWLSFGHQFGKRNGIYLSDNKGEDQSSPIFLQWLDCVHQIMHQFPNCFEFNNEFLIFLAKNCCTNRYGTFLYNNEHEREIYDGKLKTASIWSDILMNITKYKNLYYEEDKETEILTPNYGFYSLEFWDEYFLNEALQINKSYIYLDNTKKVKFNSKLDFFIWHKIEDEKKYKELEKDMEELNGCVKDIMNCFKGDEIYNTFDDYTKNYLNFIERSEKFAKLSEMK